MNAEIIAVGTELLIGQIANTNAQYISRKLNEMGVYVYYHQVVGDNIDRITETFTNALKRADIVVVTGGLGPTEDDLTKETIAKLMDLELVVNEEIMSSIKQYFSIRNREMVKSNIKQAYVPENSIPLFNNKGTAPGIYIEKGNKKVILLPGPPIEMKPMFDDFIANYLKKEQTVFSKYVNIFGIGESETEHKIKDLIHKYDDISLATYASLGQITIRITTTAKNDAEGLNKVNDLVSEIKERFNDNIYALKEIKLPNKVFEMLIETKNTISFAESCTGGLISKYITDISGSSSVYKGSVVAYHNSIKELLLNVKGETIRTYGAVSEETCMEMAHNIRKLTNSDFGISTTGIAGPTGGTDNKPVGTVFIGVNSKNGTKVKKLNINGDRNKIRCVSAMNALDLLRRELLSQYEYDIK